MRLIERTARWVDPQTFKLLPLWYPEYARGTPYFNKDWSAARMNKNRQTLQTDAKYEGNVYANKALTGALGLTAKLRPNWSCCHIWGLDDAKYQFANIVVQDRRYFSCIANMVLLPSPLKAFTDVMPEVKAMLRICARNLYDWHCDRAEVQQAVVLIDKWKDWDAYPSSWPRKVGASHPPGTVPLNAKIVELVDRRKARIRYDLENAGSGYPHEAVKQALEFWGIKL